MHLLKIQPCKSEYLYTGGWHVGLRAVDPESVPAGRQCVIAESPTGSYRGEFGTAAVVLQYPVILGGAGVRVWNER